MGELNVTKPLKNAFIFLFFGISDSNTLPVLWEAGGLGTWEMLHSSFIISHEQTENEKQILIYNNAQSKI